MEIYLVTFATLKFNSAKYTLTKSAKKHNIKNIKPYNSRSFSKTSFYDKYSTITKKSRGAGYWLWKPYYILKALNEAKEGDVIIYCDAGVDIIESIASLIDLAQKNNSGIILFENYQGSGYFSKTKNLEINEYNMYVEVNKNKYWTKRDAFILMDIDSDSYWNSPQLDASFQLYRKCQSSINFVQEWLNYCCNEQILTDTPNKCGLPNFQNMFAHIHDQAIISLLAHKYELELYRCPSQFGNHYKIEAYRIENEYLLLPYSNTPKTNSLYGTLTQHHRTNHMPFTFRLKSYIKQELDLIIARLFF